MVVMIISLVFTTFAPAVYKMVEEAQIEATGEEIEDLIAEIDQFKEDNGRLPLTLEEVFGEVPTDPWGNPYQYLNFDTIKGKGVGKKRKDKNLVPINTDYDFYSMGPDGKSTSPLTAKISRDDIVRARDGAFIGKAEDY